MRHSSLLGACRAWEVCTAETRRAASNSRHVVSLRASNGRPFPLAPPLPSPRSGNSNRLLGFTILIFLASACASTPRFVCPESDPVSARQHTLDAIDALQVGDESRARRELQLALCQEGDDELASSLLRQMEEPPDVFLGPESFEYVVQPGDTLSKISEKFLGDPFLFYALARYNEIGDPRLLEVGRTVRVPGTAPSAVDRETPSISTVSEEESYREPAKAHREAAKEDERSVLDLITPRETEAATEPPEISRPEATPKSPDASIFDPF